MKKILLFASLLVLFNSDNSMSMDKFEEAEEIRPGLNIKATPSLKRMIQNNEINDILHASENAFKECFKTVCKGTYNKYTVFVNNENKILMSFIKEKE